MEEKTPQFYITKMKYKFTHQAEEQIFQGSYSDGSLTGILTNFK